MHMALEMRRAKNARDNKWVHVVQKKSPRWIELTSERDSDHTR